MFGSAKKERARLEKLVGLENAFHREYRDKAMFPATLPLAEPSMHERARVVSLVRTLVEEAGGEVREHEVNTAINGLQREPGLIQIGKPEPEHQLVALWVAGVGVAITIAPVRLKDMEGLASFFSPNDWEWAGKDVKRHKAHVAIYDFGFEPGTEAPTGLDAAYNRATAVTSVAAALREELGALAVCWHAASNALRPEGLDAARQELMKGHAPGDLWLRLYRTEPLQGYHPGAITLGLNPFCGYEVEVTSSEIDIRDSQHFARQVALDVIDRGRMVGPGDVVEHDGLTARMELSKNRNGQDLWQFSFIDPWEAGTSG